MDISSCIMCQDLAITLSMWVLVVAACIRGAFADRGNISHSDLLHIMCLAFGSLIFCALTYVILTFSKGRSMGVDSFCILILHIDGFD